ncbi:hypothetical protein ACFSTC_42200 [Nonomuraea ferruginea]
MEIPSVSPPTARPIGIGLATALRKQRSADDAERFLTRWAEQRHVHKSAR